VCVCDFVAVKKLGFLYCNDIFTKRKKWSEIDLKVNIVPALHPSSIDANHSMCLDTGLGRKT
jgi:hypothetical protein